MKDAESADDTPEGMVQAGLYLQGIGDTVLVCLVEEEFCQDQVRALCTATADRVCMYSCTFVCMLALHACLYV